MSLTDFLGDIGLAMMGTPAAPHLDPLEFTSAIQRGGPGGFSSVDTPYGNPQQAQAPQPIPQAPKHGGGLRDFLGQLGDAIAVGAGGEAIYAKKKQREQLGEALSQFVGTDDPRMAAFVRDNPEMFATLYNAKREDKYHDRIATNDERRTAVSEGQLDLSRDELGERSRANKAGERLTARGQNVQGQIAQLHAKEAAADRALKVALQNDDQDHAERILALQEKFAEQRLRLEAQLKPGSDQGYEETTTETPGKEAVDGWLSDTPATPGTKTVTRRPLGQQPAAQGASGVSQADLEYTAKKHGITVDEVKRRLGQK